MKIEDKEKFFCQVVFRILFFLFIVFITIYVAFETGYYEVEERKKMILTEEAIQKFEEDVASGKEIDIEDYLGETKKNYNNSTSRFGLFLSNKIGKYAKDTIDNTFKFLGKVLEEQG